MVTLTGCLAKVAALHAFEKQAILPILPLLWGAMSLYGLYEGGKQLGGAVESAAKGKYGDAALQGAGGLANTALSVGGLGGAGTLTGNVARMAGKHVGMMGGMAGDIGLGMTVGGLGQTENEPAGPGQTRPPQPSFSGQSV